MVNLDRADRGETLKIAVAGTGYVGLSLAVLLARRHKVYALDIVPEKVEMVNRGRSPIADKELEEYMASGALDLTATLDPNAAYSGAEFVIVAAPTNYDPGKNYFDTSAVESVVRKVAETEPNATVVIKSTVPVGYVASLKKKLGLKNILFSPEFLREGRALYDNLHPSRVIVGCDMSDPVQRRLAERFAGLLTDAALKEDVSVLIMGTAEAEAVKLFANTYLAMRVGYFNELDTYAETRGLDAGDIIRGVSLDPRIGDHYNNPSFGYGGYCLPKDTKQLKANCAGVPQKLIDAIVAANDVRKRHIADAVLKRLAELPADENGAKVAGVYRLTMKADSDNFRESAVQDIIAGLRAEGVKVLVYEPSLESGTEFLGCLVENDFSAFVSRCALIVANRADGKLKGLENKLYTRDIFGRD